MPNLSLDEIFESSTEQVIKPSLDDIFMTDSSGNIAGERPNLLTKPVETLAKSGGEFFGSIFSAIGHPIQTVKAIGKLGTGAIQKLIPGEQGNEQYADAIGNFYKERYGGWENAKKTLLEDPVGFASDASIFLTGGGAMATKLGQLKSISRLARAGKVITTAGKTVDPLTAATNLIGKGLKLATQGKKIAPFAKTLDQPVIKASMEAGVELPASAKVTNRAVPAIETLAGKGFFGDDIVKRVETAQVQLNRYADNVISKTGQSSDLTSAGQSIFKGADTYRNRFIQIKNELYNKALLPTEKGQVIKVAPEKSLQFIEDVLKNKQEAAKLLGSSEDITYFKNLANKLRKGTQEETGILNKQGQMISRNIPIHGKEIQSAIKELNNKINNISDPIATGNKGTLKKLVTLMSEDLDNAIVMQRPDLAEAISKANQFYSEGISKLNSAYGDKIFEFGRAGQYDKIIPAIVSSSTSTDDIPKILEIIGKENAPALQSAFLEDFFKGARSPYGNFTPTGITRQINKYRPEKLQAVLTPEQFKSVKNIEQIARGMGKAEKIAGGSQTAFLGRIFGEIALSMSNPWLSFKAVVGDLLASKFIASKEGQAILAEGLTLTGNRGKQLQSISGKIGNIGKATRMGSVIRESQ